MSGNKLLAESTIRRFMKLASVDTMTNNFLEEMKYNKDDKDLEEETVTEEEEVSEEEEVNEDINALFEEEDEEEMEMDMDTEEPEMDEPEMDMDEPAMDAEPEMGAADMSLTEEEAQLLIDLGSRLAEAMGGETGEEPAMDEPAMDMDAEEPAMDEPEIDAPADEEDEEVMQEALVNEVLKRVTKRIVAAKLKNRK